MMGSDGSHFNVWLTVIASQKTVSTDHKFLKRKESQSGGWNPSRPNEFAQGEAGDCVTK